MDRTGKVNSNSSNQSQIRSRPPIETLQSLGSSSSSPTDGNGERYPERLSRPTVQVHPNVTPNDGLNAIVSPHESLVSMEIQDGTNAEQNGQLQLAGGNAQQLPSIMSLSLFNPEMRNMLGTRDSMFRNFSILSHLMELRAQVMAEEQSENVERVLTEEAILKNIRHENFKLISEETPQTKETCCICQEEYADSEELGVLDCMHKYHIDCIKTWLVLKNSCPICKRKGITLNDEEKKDV